MLFLPCQVVGTGFPYSLVLLTSDSIWVLRTSTPKHPPSREAAWNCHQNKIMDSKVNKWCPLHVCLCIYIYTHYIHVSFFNFPKGLHPVHFLTLVAGGPKPSYFQDRTSTTAAGRIYTTQLYCTHLVVPRGTQSTFGIPHLASASDSSPVVFVDVVDPTLGEKNRRDEDVGTWIERT